MGGRIMAASAAREPGARARRVQQLCALRLRLGQRGDRRPQQPGVYPPELLPQTSHAIGLKRCLRLFRFCLLWGRLRGRLGAPCRSWRSPRYRRGPLELPASQDARPVPKRASDRRRLTRAELCECLLLPAVPVAQPPDWFVRETRQGPRPIPICLPIL